MSSDSMATILRVTALEARRFREIRLPSLLQDPDSFGSTHAKASVLASTDWTRMVSEYPTFLALPASPNTVGYWS